MAKTWSSILEGLGTFSKIQCLERKTLNWEDTGAESTGTEKSVD